MRAITVLLLLFVVGLLRAEESRSASGEAIFTLDSADSAKSFQRAFTSDPTSGTTLTPALNYKGSKGGMATTGTRSQRYTTRSKQCPSKSEEIRTVVQLLGKWDVDVNTPSDFIFIIILLSHTDFEPFYKTGYWWKAELELGFEEDPDIDIRKCKQFRLNVFDSEICYGPSDEPRGECQRLEHLPIQSDAEVVLRDRIGGRLREALVAERVSPPYSPSSSFK